MNNSNFSEEVAQKALAHDILAAFNTWKYKREQPRTKDMLLEFVFASVKAQRPISFVMYWGVGVRDYTSKKEEQAFSYLNEMLNAIRAVYDEGAKVTIILTDTHAILNGHSAEHIESYYADITKIALKFDIKTVWFSSFSSLNMESLLEKREAEVIPLECMRVLEESAQKHHKIFSARKGAELYYIQNQQEKADVSAYFSDHIFITNNGSNMSFLFPDDLPIFYMYSTSKGYSAKPWFD